MSQGAVRVLVVEDEPNIRELVCLHLGHEGYTCDAVGGRPAALANAQAEPFDLMVLDLMLPGLDGLSLCRAVRNGRLNADVPDPDADRQARGGGQGGRARERRRRLPHEAVRRARTGRACPRAAAASAPRHRGAVPRRGVRSPCSRFAASRSTYRAGRCASPGRDVELTDQEFRLLHLLATHPGIVFSREALLSKIWRGDTFVTVRSVDTLVKRLRRRIETDPANPDSSRRCGAWATSSRTLEQEMQPMTRRFLATFLAIGLMAAGGYATLSAQLSPTAEWATHAQNEYQVLPNVTYLTANGFEAKLDVYRRRDVQTPQPTLVFYHGGGWIGGTKEAPSCR